MCAELRFFSQAWQSALAQHEGEERITSRVTPCVGRDSAGTGWQQLKMQVLPSFTKKRKVFVPHLYICIQYAVPWPLHLVVTAQVNS